MSTAPRRCGHHPRRRPRRISPPARGKQTLTICHNRSDRFCHSASPQQPPDTQCQNNSAPPADILQNVVARRPSRQTTFYKLWSLHPKGTTNPLPADAVTIPAAAHSAFHLPPAAVTVKHHFPKFRMKSTMPVIATSGLICNQLAFDDNNFLTNVREEKVLRREAATAG